MAKNHENIEYYEKECRFHVSHWSAVLCITYAQFSCAFAFFVGEHRVDLVIFIFVRFSEVFFV